MLVLPVIPLRYVAGPLTAVLPAERERTLLITSAVEFEVN